MITWLRKAGFLLLLIVIWGVTSSLLEASVTPGTVFARVVAGFADSSLFLAILHSLRRMLFGYLLAIVVGVGIGFMLGQNEWLDDTIGMAILWLQSIPSIAYMPLAILLFGANEYIILFVIIFGAMWPMIVNTNKGVRHVSRISVEAARVMGAGRRQVFLEVLFPGAIPDIMSGIRLAWAFSWRALVAGELLAPGVGLGQTLSHGQAMGDPNVIIGVLMLIAIFGSITDGLVFKRLEENIRKKWGLTT